MKPNSLIYFLLMAGIMLSCVRPFQYEAAEVPPFEGLAAPDPGTGYQVHVPAFPVPQNYEREIFVRMEVGNPKTIYANRFEVVCRPGTHHMIAYGYEDENESSNPEIGVMRDQNLPDGRPNFSLTMGTGAMYCGAQEENFILQLPPGIAMKIPANSTVDMNSHYFNFTDQTIFGEVFFNIHTIPQDSVVETLVIDAVDNDENLFLPPNQETVVEYTEIFGRPVRIRQIFGHMHKRGYLFLAYKVGGVNDGELLYSYNDYRHPPYQFFDEPLVFEPGEGIRTLVSYRNETNRTITFGVTSEDEMGILFYAKIEE